MTHMEIMNDTDYQWMWVMGQSPNYPESGPLEDFTPGLQSSGYLLMDSSANVVCVIKIQFFWFNSFRFIFYSLT